MAVMSDKEIEEKVENGDICIWKKGANKRFDEAVRIFGPVSTWPIGSPAFDTVRCYACFGNKQDSRHYGCDKDYCTLYDLAEQTEVD